MLEDLKEYVNNMKNSDETEGKIEFRNTDQAKVLVQASNNLNQMTDEIVNLILEYLCDYNKYFGKMFIYEGAVRFCMRI